MSDILDNGERCCLEDIIRNARKLQLEVEISYRTMYQEELDILNEVNNKLKYLILEMRNRY